MIGIGLGFRFDLVIAVLPFVLTVALLVPSAVAPSTRILALAAFFAVLAAAWSPCSVVLPAKAATPVTWRCSDCRRISIGR